MPDLTLLTQEQVNGTPLFRPLHIFEKYGLTCDISDFALAMSPGNAYKWCTISPIKKTPKGNKISAIDRRTGKHSLEDVVANSFGIRPSLTYSLIKNECIHERVIVPNKILEVEYEEYPQTKVNPQLGRELEEAYLKNDPNMDKDSPSKLTFTFPNHTKDGIRGSVSTIEYKGKKYIRYVKNVSEFDGRTFLITPEISWIEVEPITWIVDLESDIAVTKKIIAAGLNYQRLDTRTSIPKRDYLGGNIAKFLQDHHGFIDGENWIRRREYYLNPGNVFNPVLENTTGYITEDIKEKLKKIDEKLQSIPKELQDKVKNAIKKLISNYEKDIQTAKPLYGERPKEIILELEPAKKEPKKIKADLLGTLDAIIINISSNDRISSFLKELNELKKDISSSSINKPDKLITPKEIVADILYLLKMTNTNIQNSIKAKLNNAINKSKMRAEALLDLDFENADIQLVLDNIDICELDFKLAISNIHDEVNLICEKRKTYIELSDSLKANDSDFDEKELVSGEPLSIIELLKGIRYALSKLSDSKSKTELIKKFQAIANKHAHTIDMILSDKNLPEDKYQELEKDLREELAPWLADLNKYAHGQKITSPYDELMSQINLSINIVNNSASINEIDHKEKEQPIISWVLTIVTESKSLDEENKERIKNDLLGKLNRHKEELNKTKTSEMTKKEALEFIKTIVIPDIIDIELEMYRILNEIKSYRNVIMNQGRNDI